MNRTHKAMIAAGFLFVIVAFGLILAENAALKTENKYLSEQIGVNKEPPTIGATVYIRVMRAGESTFSLASVGHNVMTTAGLNWVRDMIANQSTVTNQDNSSHYIAIGTGSGGGVGSTSLVSEFDRQVGTYAEPSATNWTLTKTWGAGSFSDTDISEAGCIDKSSAGTLLNYQDFTAINLLSGDSLQVQFEFDVS